MAADGEQSLAVDLALKNKEYFLSRGTIKIPSGLFLLAFSLGTALALLSSDDLSRKVSPQPGRWEAEKI